MFPVDDDWLAAGAVIEDHDRLRPPVLEQTDLEEPVLRRRLHVRVVVVRLQRVRRYPLDAADRLLSEGRRALCVL
jgi:hypothetical protein